MISSDEGSIRLTQALGKALKEFRISRGFSQAEVGRSQHTLSVLEKGKKAVSIDDLDFIANRIGVAPLAVLARAYLMLDDSLAPDELLARVMSELESLSRVEVSNFPLK